MFKNLNSFNKKDKIVLVRSAFLGDFSVCLPFIDYLINDIGFNKANIYIVIINNNGNNPLSIILGNQSILYKNSIVLKISDYLDSLVKLRNLAKQLKVFSVFYLPFRFETVFQKLKKLTFLKLGLGVFTHINGLHLEKSDRTLSQYTHLFDLFGASFSYRDYTHFFQADEPDSFGLSKLNIALYPNSKLKMKIWPIQNYIALIQKLLSINKDARIFLIGAKEDYDYNQVIINALNIENVINIAGKYSVPQLFFFFKNIQLFIGNDGFPMHIAALAETPIVGIFTYKETIGVWDPVITKKMITIRTNVGCKECAKVSCGNPVCITSVTVQDVFNESQQLLDINPEKINKIIVNPTLKFTTFSNNA